MTKTWTVTYPEPSPCPLSVYLGSTWVGNSSDPVRNLYKVLNDVRYMFDISLYSSFVKMDSHSFRSTFLTLHPDFIERYSFTAVYEFPRTLSDHPTPFLYIHSYQCRVFRVPRFSSSRTHHSRLRSTLSLFD